MVKYEDLFAPDEKKKIQQFLVQDRAAKTIYSRMFFRRRYWYNTRLLKKYSDNLEHIEQATLRLYKMGLLKSDEDCVFDDDFERLQELLETMHLTQVKQFESDLKRVIRSLPQSALDNNRDYDLVSNNPFYFVRNTVEGLLA